jgi:hypothetical protein
VSKAVIAESYERIHRSNLIGMGVLPLQYPEGENAESLGLTGEETFDITGVTELNEGSTPQTGQGQGRRRSSSTPSCRIDTPGEADYFRHGGIMPYVLRRPAQRLTLGRDPNRWVGTRGPGRFWPWPCSRCRPCRVSSDSASASSPPDHHPGRAEPDAGAAAVAGARDAHVTLAREHDAIDWRGCGGRCRPVCSAPAWRGLVADVHDRPARRLPLPSCAGRVVLTSRTRACRSNRTSRGHGLRLGVTGTRHIDRRPTDGDCCTSTAPRQLRCTLAVYFLIGAALSLAGLRSVTHCTAGVRGRCDPVANLSPWVFIRLATAAPQGGPPAHLRSGVLAVLRAGLDRAAGPLAGVTSVAWQGRP